MSLTIRPLSTPAEFHAAHRLAYDVYVRECGILEALADHDEEILVADEENACILGAFDGERLVGSLSMLLWADAPFPSMYEQVFELGRFDDVAPRDTWAIFTRVLITPSARSSMATMQLFAHAYGVCKARGIEIVFADCQPHLLGSYRRLGFMTYAPTFDYGGSGVGVPLVGFSNDHAYLRSINSPLGLLVDPARDKPELAARGRAALAEANDPVLSRRTQPQRFAAALAQLAEHAEGGPFEGLSLAELEELLSRGYVLELGAELKLISARQNTRTAYLVLEGELVGRRSGREFYFRRGELVGELAFLTGQHRTADVYVSGRRARVLCLSEKMMRALTTDGSPAASKFLRNLTAILAQRLAG